MQTGQVADTDDDLAADLYELAMARLDAAGYVHYEVSNWARHAGGNEPWAAPSFACQHNLVYWRNEDYLGIGPGAHSHLRTAGPAGFASERRWGNRKPVPGYVQRIRRREAVEAFVEEIDASLAMGETMMLGLRLVREGVPLDRFAALHNRSLVDVYATQLVELKQRGLLTVDDQRVRLTPNGLMIGNQVFAAFLPD